LTANCKPHVSHPIQRASGQNGLTSATDTPDIMSIFQIFDPNLFGVCRLLKNSTEENGSRVDATVHIATAIQATQEVCAILRIQAALQRRGFGVDTSVVLTRTAFSED
jgi:hypothetical protein